jgi:hypothetical protein
MTKMRFTVVFLGLVLLGGTVSAWELAAKTLPERVKDVDIIVVGSVGAIHSRAPSPIMGVGDVWTVTLDVSKTLKGVLPGNSRVTFTDVAIEDSPKFQPTDPRVWLLKASSDGALFSAPASYESILAASRESEVRSALQPPQP